MSLFRLIALLLLALCCEQFLSPANAQVKAPKAPGGSVTGTVTIKGKPAQGVTVYARPGQSYGPFEPTIKAKTDQDGKYRMADVPPGSYRVSVLAPGFVPPTTNYRNETVVVRENETVEGIDFALVRGGVITGKVVDSNGRPVIEQYIRVVQAGGNAETFPLQNTTAMTDDRGIYRLFGLFPGSYKVFVGQQGDRLMTIYSGLPRYKQTFHPSATDESEAAVIEVSEGSEAKNIDIAVEPPKPNFGVSGTVVDGESGKPVPKANLMLAEAGIPKLGSVSVRATASNSKGEFRIENLPPGQYAISVSVLDNDLHSDAVNFEVVDQDVGGIIIKTSNGASLTGTVVLENVTNQTARTKLSELSVQLFVQTSEDRGYSKESPIGPDGSFQFRGLLEGQANLTLTTRDRSQLRGFVVSRVERNDVVQPLYFDLKASDQLAGFKVVVAYGNAVIRGTIKPASGSFPPDTRLFVQINFPGDRSNRIRSPQVDPHGNFTIEGLPAGTYILTAGAMPPGETRPAVNRQQIQLMENATTDLTITIDLNAKIGNPQ